MLGLNFGNKPKSQSVGLFVSFIDNNINIYIINFQKANFTNKTWSWFMNICLYKYHKIYMHLMKE